MSAFLKAHTKFCIPFIIVTEFVITFPVYHDYRSFLCTYISLQFLIGECTLSTKTSGHLTSVICIASRVSPTFQMSTVISTSCKEHNRILIQTHCLKQMDIFLLPEVGPNMPSFSSTHALFPSMPSPLTPLYH